MKNILILFSSDQIGGAERSLSRMALEIKDKNFKMATLHGHGPWSEWIMSRGQAAIAFGPKRRSRRITILAYYRLILYLLHNQVDLLYVCGVRASFVVRLIVLFFPSIKIVHAVRWNPNSSSKLDLFFRFIEKNFGFMVDGWITNSRIAKDTLVGSCSISEDRVKIIYNGLPEFPLLLPPFENKPYEVLTVSNLSARKGHIPYIEKCIKKVIEEVPNAKFRFIGRDDMKGEVQNLINKNNLTKSVFYDGFQSNPSEWYKKARVFVLPSLWNEGCPTAILEAMSYGIPCVSFGIDGLPELYRHGDHGSFVRIHDYEKLAQAIVDYLLNEDRAKQTGEAARGHVREHFGSQNMIKQHCEYFSELLGEKNK